MATPWMKHLTFCIILVLRAMGHHLRTMSIKEMWYASDE
jgi:hypothetical protein